MPRGLVVYHLRYTICAEESLMLDQHPGSALRGAIFHALLRRFCALPQQPECATCPLAQSCPVAALVAPMRDESTRGRDVPRPFIIRPPLIAAYGEDGMRLEAGQSVSFEMLLVGSAARLFPYLVMATATLQGQGLGRPLRANGGRRGRFIVERIVAHHHFTDGEVMLFRAGQSQVGVPDLAITEADIHTRAAQMNAAQLRVRFLTPMRLITDGHLLHQPDPVVLVRRLAERMDALEREYAPVVVGAGESAVGRWRSIADSCNLTLAASDVAWVDTQSYSSRQHRRTPTGGFIGTATFTGTPAPELRELLAWGELLHVGKDVVKGNGWYQIEN
jgi:hypothetical protein